MLGRWDRGPAAREMPGFAKTTALFLVVYLGTFLLIFRWMADEDNGKVALGFALLAAELVPFVWLRVRSLRRWRLALRAEASTILQKRSKLASSRDAAVDDDDPANPYWATGTYQPRRYHAAFDGTSSEHRDYIRDAYGDLDTWESNRPD